MSFKPHYKPLDTVMHPVQLLLYAFTLVVTSCSFVALNTIYMLTTTQFLFLAQAYPNSQLYVIYLPAWHLYLFHVEKTSKFNISKPELVTVAPKPTAPLSSTSQIMATRVFQLLWLKTVESALPPSGLDSPPI